MKINLDEIFDQKHLIYLESIAEKIGKLYYIPPEEKHVDISDPAKLRELLMKARYKYSLVERNDLKLFDSVINTIDTLHIKPKPKIETPEPEEQPTNNTCDHFDIRFYICRQNGTFHYYKQPCPWMVNGPPKFYSQTNCAGYDPLKEKKEKEKKTTPEKYIYTGKARNLQRESNFQ